MIGTRCSSLWAAHVRSNLPAPSYGMLSYSRVICSDEQHVESISAKSQTHGLKRFSCLM